MTYQQLKERIMQVAHSGQSPQKAQAAIAYLEFAARYAKEQYPALAEQCVALAQEILDRENAQCQCLQ